MIKQVGFNMLKPSGHIWIIADQKKKHIPQRRGTKHISSQSKPGFAGVFNMGWDCFVFFKLSWIDDPNFQLKPPAAHMGYHGMLN